MEQPDPGNTIQMQPEGYALITLRGKQDYLKLDAVARQCKAMAADLQAEGKPLLGLVDFTNDPGFSTGTNKAVMQALEEIPYHRVALFGKGGVLGEVTQAVVSALGKSDRTRVFGTREEALAWLLMRDPVHGYGN